MESGAFVYIKFQAYMSMLLPLSTIFLTSLINVLFDLLLLQCLISLINVLIDLLLLQCLISLINVLINLLLLQCLISLINALIDLSFTTMLNFSN